MSLLNVWGHIAMVPACRSGTVTNMVPHRNVIPQTQDMTTHPVTEFRHRADLSLYYTLMWNATLEYTATHYNFLGQTRSGKRSQAFHTHHRTLYDAGIVVARQKIDRKCSVHTESWTRDLWCANPLRYQLAHSCFYFYHAIIYFLLNTVYVKENDTTVLVTLSLARLPTHA